jgi:Bacteriocin-protection, YdeI or OmpD-Associated
VRVQRFTTTARDGGRGRVLIPVPFDPDVVWAPKPRHHVGGTVNGMPIRGIVELNGGVRGFLLGPAWLRGCGLAVGDEVQVEVEPEGPQRADLAADVAAALDTNPQAGEFFDSLAQFYRRGYLRWIDATKRSPDLRAQRIAIMVELLTAGVKDYHNQ